MSELEEWQGQTPANNSENNDNGGRDGYRSYNSERTGQRPRFNPNANGERPRRPRFNSSERNHGNNSQMGFRPESFGHNDERQGGYSNYGYKGPRQGFSYNSDERPGFSRQHTTYTHGYRPNRGGNSFSSNEGGFRPSSFNRGGQQRTEGFGGSYGQQRQGGYGQRQGGFGSRGQQRQGGYNPNNRYSMKKQIEYKEYIEDPNAPIRLNKFLANAGVCSRREADQFIQAGVVKVNGQIASELGTKVLRTDTVHFHDQLVNPEKKVYLLLNKPKDYVTTSDDPQQRKTVLELVKNACRERIYPVGRLDRNTTGVLLFTNDGDLASKLTHPKFLKKKVYHVFLDKNVSAADLKQIAEGVTLEDGEVHADAISYASDTDKKQIGIEIHSGKNRIVRRIFESLGYRVLKLDRVLFAGLTKKGLKRGDWRFLTEQEVAMLHMGSFE